jgi:hypothetical protein
MSAVKGLSPTEVELKTIFDDLVNERGTQERNWEEFAGWTLPYLFPEDDQANNAEMQHDYQALGARAVNHLANKIVMTLFAPARPFFRLELTQEQQDELEDEGISPANIETLTGSVEKQAMRNMEKIRLRTSVIMALKNLIALGNTLLFFPPNSGQTGSNSQVYSLKDYVVRRDLGGKVIQIVTRDRRVCSTLTSDLRDACLAKGHKLDDKVDLYTGVTRQADGKFYVKQEVDEVTVVGKSYGVYPAEDLPWIPLTWNLVRGEDYGVGLVEEYAGDFSVISELSETVLNIAAIAADVKILVSPESQVDIQELNDSAPGTYVSGRPEDLAYAQLEKLQDFTFVESTLEKYERRIGGAFLLNTAVTRDAERVTAEEIRLQANELEASLGGVYSRLAEEMQQPLARMLLDTVDSALKDIEPVILTGVESLSRNSEHEQMMLFLNDLTIFNNVPEQLLGVIKLNDMSKILATNRGIEHDKFMKTDKELEQERERAKDEAEEMQAREAAAQAAGQSAGSQEPIV